MILMKILMAAALALTGTAQTTTATCEPATTAETMLVGMEGPNGQPTRDIITTYSPRYMRDFGVKLNGESLTSLTPHGTGKLADMPATTIPHVSWKTDVSRLSAWLDGLDRPIYLTWYHEPMGDVTPADYRAAASQIQTIIDRHPNGHYVIGHGPIVTRWWLDEGKGNPLDWWYPGATFYGIDWYEPTTTYKGAPNMTIALDRVRAALPGVRILLPEYGLLVGGTDRAGAIHRDMDFFRAQPDVDAVAYWNSATSTRDYRISVPSAECTEWQAQVALSA